MAEGLTRELLINEEATIAKKLAHSGEELLGKSDGLLCT